ncbi:hypothetical protein BH10PSE1_BH10PSE1_00880 [soil metagenome]
MAGMKDEAGRGGGSRCLANDHLARLQAMTDECMAALAAVELKPGDVLAVERKTRAIGAMARTIKLVDGLRPKPAKPHANDKEDNDMSEGETGHGDDMDPTEVAAIRAELESRLDSIRAAVETKRMAGWPDRTGDDGVAGEHAAPA